MSHSIWSIFIHTMFCKPPDFVCSLDSLDQRLPTLALTMHSCCSFLNCSFARPKKRESHAARALPKSGQVGIERSHEHGKHWKVQILMKNRHSVVLKTSSSSRERSAHAMGITVFCRHRHIVPSAAWRCRIFCNASGIEHLWSLDIFSLELLSEIFWNLLILDGSHSASSCA